MIAHLRLQSPTERRAVLVDQGAVGVTAAALRGELGFPDDWMDSDRYDCAVSDQPVHEDYWRTLADVQAELRVVRARAALLADQLAHAQATLVELADGRDGLVGLP